MKQGRKSALGGKCCFLRRLGPHAGTADGFGRIISMHTSNRDLLTRPNGLRVLWSGWPLILMLLPLAFAQPACQTYDRERSIKLASRKDAPAEVAKQVEALIPFALDRSVKIRPSLLKIGSGCLIGADGWIATAAHVIRGETQVEVILNNGVVLPARVMGVSVGNDYALLKVEATNLPYFKLGPRPKLGEHVVAFGVSYRSGPSDIAASVSIGQCLYPEVNIPGDIGSYYYKAVFHTAPIFPGDSGGPLVTLDGHLVGLHGGYAGENASVASSIAQLWRDIRRPDGRLDPEAATQGKTLPVRWPARIPRDFAQSAQWTVESVTDTLIAEYAKRNPGYVRGVLARTKKRYLKLRETDGRSDDDLVRAMLTEVFEILAEFKRTRSS